MRETTTIPGSGFIRNVVSVLAFGLAGALATALVVVGAVGATLFGTAVVVGNAVTPLRGRVPRRPRRRSPARRLAATFAPAALLAAVAVAGADVAGPDDTPAQAYGPMQAGTTYSGAFRSSDDVDHLAFKVDKAGQRLHFEVNDTVQNCGSPYPIECAVWGTLVDAAGNQLGGEGSSAGTGEVDPGTNDVIDWTFTEPGTYYLAMDSGGMNPTYTVRYDVVAGAPAPAPTGTAAPGVLSFSVRSPQHGTTVRARANFGQTVRTLTAKLTTRAVRPVSFGRVVQSNLPSGPRTLRVALNRAGRAALARAGRVRLRLRLTVISQNGDKTVKSRLLTLTR